MAASQSQPARKRRGAYATPHWLVDEIVRHTLPRARGRSVRVLDPACGDGRFLVAAGRHLTRAGATPVLVGIDIDPDAVAAAAANLAEFDEVELRLGDALATPLDDLRPDVVLGNPPFLSQLATVTTRGGASRHGGGPYADAAAEFLAVAISAVPPGGRVGLVLPQSILASRDAAPVRAHVDRLAEMRWSWWSPRDVFDAQVVVCALSFERRTARCAVVNGQPWSHVVTSALDVPPLPPLRSAGVLAARARITANFRDQYYALVPAVADDGRGPPLITSGLIDPARCHWGRRDVTFARRRFGRPQVDVGALALRMQRWAEELLVPKVLIANQTRIIEAVADPTGRWLPGVPVLTARPTGGDVWSIAAVLTSPIATAWAWQRAAGTGLSGGALRLGPRWLGELPWPQRPLTAAVSALRAGDVNSCGRAVLSAYGLDPHAAASARLHRWWASHLPG